MKKNKNSLPDENITANDSAKKKQKKGIIIAFALMLTIIILTYVIIPGISYIAEKIKEANDDGYKSDYMDDIKSLSFYPADYNENIFEDEEYMSQNRYIAYTKGSDTFIITNNDYSIYDPTVGFFAEYFDTVINGRYEEYDSYFTEEYFENQKNKERFTPQKLYDIEIKFKSTSDVDGATSYIYYVNYKICKNNGTFRNDIESDASRTLVYQLLLYNDGTILINYIGR